MASDTSGGSRQLTNLRDLARRVETDDGLAGLLGAAMRLMVLEGDFPAAAVSVVREGGYCETLAAAGSPALREVLIGTRFAVESYQTELAAAEPWGVLRFVAVEHSASIGVLHSARESLGALPDVNGTLYAQLNSDSGRLIGMISVEVPEDTPAPGIAAQKIIAEIAELVADCIEKHFGFDEEEPEPAPTTSRHSSREPDEQSSEVLQFKDPETGLPNREGLEAAFTATLERLRRDGTTAAVLYCVLEEFDAIAESLGTPIVNEVVRRVSKRLQDTVRAYDVVARLAPDTMAIVADNIAPQDTGTLVTRLRRNLAKVHIVEDEVIRVRGSVGVALVNEETVDAESTLRIAERACEAARNGANSTYVLYSRYARSPMSAPKIY